MGVLYVIIRLQLVGSCYVFTVNDSPHPQASVTLGFLNTNFELSLRILSNRLSIARTFDGDVPKRVFVPVHFASNDGKERFAVYDDFDAVLLHDFVELGRTVYVFEVIG